MQNATTFLLFDTQIGYLPNKADGRFHPFTRWQGMVVGVDVVGEDAVDKIIGPNKKKMRQNASAADDADANNQLAESIPDWDKKPDDMEACNDSVTITG